MALLKSNATVKIDPPYTKIINGQPVTYTSTVVHSFLMYDYYEDFDVEIGALLYDWQQTEKGQWVLEHAVEKPVYYKSYDYQSLGARVIIIARLTGQDLTFFKLKWGQDV